MSTMKEKALQIKENIPAVFIALKRKDTPFYAKAAAAATICYALSPIDLIPDFIPILGYLDDLIILPGLIALTVSLIPPAILSECKEEAKSRENVRGKKWYYAIPIISVWILLIGFILWKMII